MWVWIIPITIIVTTWFICSLLRGSKQCDDAYDEALKKEGIDRDGN